MFDFDGVIVDSLDIFSTAFLDACSGRRRGRLQDARRPARGDGGQLLRRHARARRPDDARVAEVLRRLGDTLVRARHWLKPFPLMPQVLEEPARRADRGRRDLEPDRGGGGLAARATPSTA